MISITIGYPEVTSEAVMNCHVVHRQCVVLAEISSKVFIIGRTASGCRKKQQPRWVQLNRTYGISVH